MSEIPCGKVTRALTCSLCGAQVTEFSVQVNEQTHRAEFRATCERGHKLEKDWQSGEQPGDLPVKDDLVVQ